LGTRMVCCDSFGWQHQAPYSAAIEADPVADRYVKTHTAHFYASRATGPLPTDERVWMSEWTPNGSAWVEAWDDGTPASGFTMAESIHEAFAVGQATGYVSWVGASLGTTRAFIQIANEGDGYRVSKRLWAFAAYARFIRPDAVRVPAQVADPTMKVTAFRNRDGSMIVELLNTGTASVSTTLTTDVRIHRATTYLTDETHSVERVGEVRAPGKHRLPVEVPARSLTTVVLR
jgi:O-glycosyl hydrolase